MNFEQMLLVESTNLLSESTKMTPTQRKKVAELGKIGWSIKTKNDDDVVMYKGDKESVVRGDGKVEVLQEGKYVDVTALIDALGVEV